MGAYENPITVVDNQSGQIWANTISRVSKATTDYIDFTRQKDDELAKKIQDQLDWAAEYASKNQEQVYANLAKLGADSIYSKEADNVLNLITENRIAMQNASTKGELQAAQKGFGEAQKRLQQLYSVIQMDEESKAFYGEEYNPATAGLQGGMSKSKPGTADWVAAQNVNNGFAKGTKEVYWDDNTGAYKIKFSGENIQGVIDKDARILFGYDPGKVINIDEMIDGTYQKNNFLDKNNQLTANAMSNKKFTQQYGNGKYETLFTETDIERIAKTTTPLFQAQARSFFTVPEDAEGVWAIIGKGSNKQFSASELLQQGSEMQNEFVDAYTKYASKRIKPYKEDKTYQIKSDKKDDLGAGGKGYGKINITPKELYDRFKNKPAISFAQFIDIPNVEYDSNTNIVMVPATAKTKAETFDLSNEQGASKFFTVVLENYPGIGGSQDAQNFKNDFFKLIKAEMGKVQEAATNGTGRLNSVLPLIK